MTTTTKNGFRLLPRLAWTRVERALAMLVLLAITHGWLLALFGYVLARAEHEPLLPVPLLRAQLPVLAAFLAGCVLLFLVGLRLRRQRPDALGFQHVCAWYHVLTMLWIGYLFGTLSLPAGAVLMSSTLTGYILFERPVIRLAFALGVAGLFGLSLAAALGLLPYAPALPSPQDRAGALRWTTVTLALAGPHVLTCIVITAEMLRLWQRRERQLERLGLTDVLTGVPNRRHILQRLEAALARTREQGRPLAVALLDLDHFKRINDGWGHAAGDQVLQAVARALQEELHDRDAVGRFGGEEFLLVLPDIAPEALALLLERCRARLAALELRAADGTRLPVSASFGAAWCAGGTTAEALVQAADARLYAAKQAGRNQIQLATLDAAAPAAPAPRVVRGPASPPPAARLLHVLGEFLSGWQRWTPVDKQMFHLGLSILMFANYMAWAVWVNLRADRARLVDTALYAPFMGFMAAVMGLFAALIGVGLLIRRRWPGSVAYQVVGQQCFGMALIALGHAVGMLSFATGVMLVSMPLVGFIYFERRIVWWSLATPLLLTVALGYASALGALPYAPALAPGMDRYQPHSLFWVLSFYHFTWITVLVVVAMADQTIGRWRLRGQQVRELSRTDMLTGVYNRRSILALVEKEVARARQKGLPLALGNLCTTPPTRSWRRVQGQYRFVGWDRNRC